MRIIFGILASAAGIYSLLIFIRIILSWFGNISNEKPVEILSRFTDPYLGWWRKTLNIRIGALDFSVVAAIAFLSVVQSVFFILYGSARITAGIILAIVLSAVWNVISFIIFFCILVIILRLIAYLTNMDIYNSFWSIVNSISQPILYRLNRIVFGKRIGGFLNGIIISLLLLIALLIAGGFVVRMAAGYLSGLPV
ncbi:MAG: YggT family protein [Treponema sp.]|nr:YggT family protein [Treponema sp.]MCL2271304.1 YggT family protein [Treponema sp.]